MKLAESRISKKPDLPTGNPHHWGERKIKEAFRYFADYYLPGGILYEHFGFDKQPPVTCNEFKRALLEDFDARGDVWLDVWEWATIERERVRDRVLVNRGYATVG